MIFIQIPKKPQMSDFNTDEASVYRAQSTNNNISKQHKEYSQNNQSASYIIGFLIFFILIFSLVKSLKPDIPIIGSIFIAGLGGTLILAPLAYFLCLLVENTGKAIEPSRTPKNDKSYDNANRYIKTKKLYDSKIEYLSRHYYGLSECQFNITTYNKYWIEQFNQRIKTIIHNKRIESLWHITIDGNIFLTNLDLVGCSSSQRISQSLYEGEYEGGKRLITYICSLDSPSTLDWFIKQINQRDLFGGLIITQENAHTQSWFNDILKKNNIKLLHIKNFEKIIDRIALNENFEPREIMTKCPLTSVEITYIALWGNTYSGQRLRPSGFKFQLIEEAFTSKKDIFDKIKSLPKTDGMYGIIQCKMNNTFPIYGVMYFQQNGEISSFLRYFHAVINDKTKEISKIVRGYQRMRFDCGEYWYKGWRDSCPTEDDPFF